MIKIQKILFSDFGKPVYAKLQINFTSELFAWGKIKLLVDHLELI